MLMGRSVEIDLLRGAEVWIRRQVAVLECRSEGRALCLSVWELIAGLGLSKVYTHTERQQNLNNSDTMPIYQLSTSYLPGKQSAILTNTD